MITLFVALYSLLCLCTTGNPTDIQEFQVKTVKRGEAVTMECNIIGLKNKNSLVWYRQSFGKVPQVFVRQYGNSYIFAEGFNNSRFSVTVKDKKFDLNINEIREDDGGEYFCGYVEGSTVKFTSGTCLQFEEMKLCPTPGTLKNTHSVTHQGSNSRDGEGSGGVYWVIFLTVLNIISVIIIIVLAGVLIEYQTKGASSHNHQTPTIQVDDDEDVLNYTAVSFAEKPSSNHPEIYEQPKCNYSQSLETTVLYFALTD